MRQLLTRLEDDLHARLKQRAEAERRSINTLVVRALETALAEGDAVTLLRLRAEGRAVRPPRPARVPSRSQVDGAGRGVGSAVSEALATDRSAR